MNDLTLAQAKLPEADSRHPRLEGLELHSRLLNSVPREVAKRMTAEDIPALRSYLSEAKALARPVGETEAIRTLEALFLHYPARALSQAEHGLIWGDWIDDLADIPADMLASACRMWRRSSERFAPSPGQLLAKVGGSKHWGLERKAFVRRAEEVLSLVEGGQ